MAAPSENRFSAIRTTPTSPEFSAQPRHSVYNPYDSNDQDTPSKLESNDTAQHPYPPLHSTQHGRSNKFLDVYMGISSILGFKEKPSFVLFFIFGGALVGFCLARSFMLNPDNVQHKTVPGEWFWYRQKLYHPAIILHIYLCIIAGAMVIFQFIPAIRRRMMILHRLNGYMTLLLIIPGLVTGGVVARRSFGGAPVTQAAFYVIALLSVGSLVIGYLSVKQTRRHRKWMLRAVAYLGTIITARIISIISKHILSDNGGYYALWSCDELQFLQDNGQGVPDFAASYPICGTTPRQSGSSPVPAPLAPALVKLGGYPVNKASAVRATFGMALWIALIIHIISAEIYIRSSESANQHRIGFILQRDKDESATHHDH